MFPLKLTQGIATKRWSINVALEEFLRNNRNKKP